MNVILTFFTITIKNMNKKCMPSQFFSISIFIASLIFSFESYSQKKTEQYQFTVNLNNTSDDKLTEVSFSFLDDDFFFSFFSFFYQSVVKSVA